MKKLLLSLALSGVLLHCQAPAPRPTEPKPPIVLVTLADFRVDNLSIFGGPELLTPHLNRFAEQADFKTRAIAPSPTLNPSLASLFTGLPPWLHGIRHEWNRTLKSSLRSLPEVLREAGYGTSGYYGRLYPRSSHGYEHGFDVFKPAHESRHLKSRLKTLEHGHFVWVHLEGASPPWSYYRRFEEVIPESTEDLPERIRRERVALFFEKDAPQGRALERLAAMYHLNVAALDAAFGDLVEALQESTVYAETTFVVVGVNGLSLGEEGRVGSVLGTHRSLLEVPLLIHRPGTKKEAWPSDTEAIPTRSLFATISDWVGIAAPPAVAPALTHGTPKGVLSEAYFGNGYNEFSWVEEGFQLRRRAYFGEGDPEYTAMRRAILFPDRKFVLPSKRSAKKLRRQLRNEFRSHPPGIDEDLHQGLWEWTADGRTRRSDDGLKQADWGRSMEKSWSAFASPTEKPTDLQLAP